MFRSAIARTSKFIPIGPCSHRPSERALFPPVILSLFVLTSLVPHRFLYAERETLVGILSMGLRILPSGLMALLAVLWVLRCRKRAGTIALSVPAFASMLLFLCITLLSGLGALDPFRAISRTLYYALTGFLVYFIVVCTFGKEDVSRFVHTIVAVSSLVAILAIVEFVLDRNVLYTDVFSPDNPMYFQFASMPVGRHPDVVARFGGRVVSTVGHPIFLGTYLVLCAPFCLALYLSSRKSTAKLLYLGGFSLLSLALFITFSRGAWIAFLSSTYLYLKNVPGRKKGIVAILVLSFLVASASVLGVAKSRKAFQNRLENTYTGYVKAFREARRVQAYRRTADMLSLSPLLGVGVANYRIWSPDDETPDNAYLAVLAENGVLGFGIMAFIFYLVLGALSAHNRGENPERPWGDPTISAFRYSLIGFLIHIVTCDALYFPTTRIVFWMVAGAGMALVRSGQRRAVSDGLSRP